VAYLPGDERHWRNFLSAQLRSYVLQLLLRGVADVAGLRVQHTWWIHAGCFALGCSGRRTIGVES
jgi:hypothetical protein